MPVTANRPTLPARSPAKFDFGSLEADVRVQVLRQAAAIRELNCDSLAGKIEIGRRLATIRKLVAWFDFQPIVDAEFGWSKTTTTNYKNVARIFGNLKPGRLARFDWSALVVLARRDVPRPARIEALRRARAGENIGKQLAESIVARHLHSLVADPDAEQLVNGVFQALGKFENFRDRLTASQRDRVLSRLISAANLLSDPQE